jgi:hypothetical protein
MQTWPEEISGKGDGLRLAAIPEREILDVAGQGDQLNGNLDRGTGLLCKAAERHQYSDK